MAPAISDPGHIDIGDTPEDSRHGVPGDDQPGNWPHASTGDDIEMV